MRKQSVISTASHLNRNADVAEIPFFHVWHMDIAEIEFETACLKIRGCVATLCHLVGEPLQF